MPNLEGFIKLAGQLKRLKRTGWVKRNVADSESVADHSFRAALMAMVIGHSKRQRGEHLDLERALCLALIHDLPEALTGDLDPEAKSRLGERRTREMEGDAVAQALLLLPEELRDLYGGLFDEYRAQSTEEARLVRQVDRAETVLQAREYAELGEGERLDEFWRGWRNRVIDPDLSELLNGFFR